MDFYSTAAWRWCAKYVLLFYADNNGNVSCSTSGRIYQVTDRNMQCGHFIKVKDGSSTNYSTALDFENLAPQCYQDNRYYAGKPDVMRKWLVEKHGEDAVRNLEIKKFNICKLDDLILSEFAKIYKAKFKELLVSRNIKNPWVKSDTHRTI